MEDSKTLIETWALTVESAKSEKCRVTMITLFDCLCVGLFQFKNEPMRYQLMADTKTRYFGRTGIALRNRWQHSWVNHRDYVRAKALADALTDWMSKPVNLTSKCPPKSLGSSECRLTHFIPERYARPQKETTGEGS